MWGHDINRAIAYNEAAKKALIPRGVIINDLYSAVATDIKGNICDDYLHLSEKGIQICAKQTADLIRQTVK